MDIYVPYAYAFGGMFEGCISLETARVQGERDAGSFMSIVHMFRGCSALKNVELIDIKTGGETDFKEVFKSCSSLENIDLSTLDFSSATDLDYMLQGCSSLISLDLSGHSWVSGGPKMSGIISTCPNLTEIIVDENVQPS